MFKKLLLSSTILSLVGCSTIQTQFQTVKSKPIISPVADSIANKRQCVQHIIGDYVNGSGHHGIGLFIRDITDGRVSGNGDITDRTLVANRIYLAGSLFKLHESRKQILVMDNMPNGLSEGLTSSGFPPNEIISDLSERLRIYIENNRQMPVTSAGFYVIDASFTRFDTDGYRSDGIGTTLEYDKNTNADFSFGSAKDKRYMALTVNIIDIITNSVVESETFEILVSKDKKDKTFKIVRKGLGFGFTDEINTIESIHSAQNILLDYSAMWILDQFTEENLLSRTCKI